MIPSSCPVCGGPLEVEEWEMGKETYCPSTPCHYKRVQNYDTGRDEVFMEKPSA